MVSRKLLFCSLNTALIGAGAWQTRCVGHDVNYYIEAESDREIADGFEEKTEDWCVELDWTDTVVFDDSWVSGSDHRENPDTSRRGYSRSSRYSGRHSGSTC